MEEHNVYTVYSGMKPNHKNDDIHTLTAGSTTYNLYSVLMEAIYLIQLSA